ncbi:MAG: protein kinase [Cellvibrionaceae bacterium]|nr:protein kinase [Cellvibrionaceae bacterium]
MKEIDCPEKISHYRILGVLGRGAMGVVYLAEDARLKRKVAIKCLHKSQHAEVLIQRLRREAKSLAKLDHPNVVKVYDLIEQKGDVALVMEYVEGQSLNQRIKGFHLSLRQKLALLVQILDGLSAAHRAGIIHRDLKLDNILVDIDGHAKIGDFGIAKKQSEETVELSRHGGVLGSLAAMSPEQIRGEDLTEASDIFSFGMIAWQILKERHPFQAENELLKVEKILNEPAASFQEEGLPKDLVEHLDKTLVKDPANRASDISEIIKLLRACSKNLNESESDPTLTNVSELFRKKSFKDVRRKLLIAVSALLLITILSFILISHIKPENETVYVAVLPPVLHVEDSLSYAEVQKTVYDALQEGVINLDDSYLIPAFEVADYLEEIDQIFSALSADAVLKSELSCRDFRCDLNLILESSKGEVSRRLDHIVDPKLLEIHRLTQLNLAELFPGRKGLLALSEVVSEQDYKEYVKLNSNSQESESNYTELIFQLQGLISRAPDFEPLYELLIKISLDQYSETKDESFKELILEALKTAEYSKINRNKLGLLRAEVYAEIGQLDQALKEVSKLENDFGDIRQIHTLKGLVEEKRENYKTAVFHFQAASELRPSVRAYRDMAINYWYLGNVDKAISSLNKALEINPKDMRASLSLAAFYMTKGDLDKAEELYLEFEEKSQVSSTVVNIGLLYMLKRQYKKAEKYLILAGQKTQKEGNWRLNLADNYLLQGNDEKAKEHYLILIDSLKFENDSDSLAGLAQAYIHTGDSKKALEALQGAKQISPNNSDTLYAEAIVYTKLLDFSSALLAAEKSIELGVGKVWYLLSWFDPICESEDYRKQFMELTGNPCLI